MRHAVGVDRSGRATGGTRSRAGSRTRSASEDRCRGRTTPFGARASAHTSTVAYELGRVFRDVLLHERLLPAMDAYHRERTVLECGDDPVVHRVEVVDEVRASWRFAPSKSGWSRFVSGTPARDSSDFEPLITATVPGTAHAWSGEPRCVSVGSARDHLDAAHGVRSALPVRLRSQARGLLGAVRRPCGARRCHRYRRRSAHRDLRIPPRLDGPRQRHRGSRPDRFPVVDSGGVHGSRSQDDGPHVRDERRTPVYACISARRSRAGCAAAATRR